jgi:predicted nuclease of predicted toxin-antitoxin system
MYTNFAKDPTLKAKLVKLQTKKKRASLYPSTNDMKILAEADELGAVYLVNLITDDSDFLEFKDVIEKELKLKIIALLNVPHFFDNT